MFSFIDDLPSPAQIRARMSKTIKAYRVDSYIRSSRIVQTAKRLACDEQLKIDPISWIWQRRPTRTSMAEWRILRFTRRNKAAIAGFCAGVVVMLVTNGVVIAGNFGGMSDSAVHQTVVYPNL